MTDRMQLTLDAVGPATTIYGETVTLGVEVLSTDGDRVILRMVVLRKGDSHVLFADLPQSLLAGEVLDFKVGLKLE